jgi:hypothetical protein
MIMYNHQDDDRDRLAELAAIWPYDGPHSAETVTSAARGVSELVRYLDNATSVPGTYTYMSKAANVASSLSEAVHRLDQLLDQMSRAIADHVDSGDLYDDHRPHDPFAGAARANLACQQTMRARTAVLALAEELAAVSSTLGAIGHR